MDYKTIFIVDPIRGERIHLAKFLSEEIFTVMTFVSPNDCFKKSDLISCDLMVFVPRKEKNEIKHLMNIKKKVRKIPVIFLLTDEFPDIILAEITANGFPNVYKASNNEKVREIMLGILAEEGLPPRTEVPHPVPISQEVQSALSPRPE
jgi:DNA-binding NtrC family response regulator